MRGFWDITRIRRQFVAINDNGGEKRQIKGLNLMDLTTPGTLKQLAEQIKSDIDEWCVKTYDDGSRSHLGASQIGHNCKRHLWYLFRWIKHKTHSGRQYRLFQRGHFEEPRFKMYLEGIGCKVTEFDEANLHEQDKGKRQIRINGCKGHFGGSLDAIITLPARYGFENVVFLGEYKTSGTGKKFSNLIQNGCELEKYQHFCQQSIYGYKLGIKYGIYIVVNKNDDDLHIEVIELNWELGVDLESKAEEIIFSEIPPNKISASPSHFECNWCDHKNVCWELDKKVDINCRSCVCSKPVDNAEWECSKYGIIPKEYIKQACSEWKSILGG